MIVELLGPPGAGKTTLLPHVVSAISDITGGECRDVTAAVHARLERSRLSRALRFIAPFGSRRLRTLLVDLPYGVRFIAAHPILTAMVLIAVGRTGLGWGHRWTLFTRWAGVAARQDFVARDRDRGAVVFDEGLYHRTVNLFAWRSVTGDPRHRRTERGELRRYLRHAPAPDIAIFVDAPDAETGRRLNERGLPTRLRGRPRAEAAAFLEAAGRIVRDVPREATSRTRWITIANIDATSRAAEELRAALVAELARTAEPWPVAPARHWPVMVRPDRWWTDRTRALAVADRNELADIIESFGLADVTDARSVGSGRSWTVIVRTDGGSVVVKRYKASVEDDAIRSEHHALRRLEELAIPAPRLLASAAGETLVRRDSARYAAYEHIAGHVPVHHLLTTPREGRRLADAAGRGLARLHDVLADGASAVRPKTGLDDRGTRADPSFRHADLLRRGHHEVLTDGLSERLLAVDAQLVAATLATTTVHGDYGPYNILVRPGHPLVVIDFELARVDWRLLDIVTALPRFAASRGRLFARRVDAFVDGYLAVAPSMHSELHHAATLMEFLALRRAAVCIERHRSAGDHWLGEAKAHLASARALAHRTHPVIKHLERVAS